MTYVQMMQRYAAVAGLRRRLIIKVPVLSPGLSSHWVGLVTPVPASIARPLVQSLRHEVVCSEHDITHYIPDPPEGLIGFDDAVRRALARIKEAKVATRWSEASTPGAPSDPWPGDPAWAGGSLYRQTQDISVDAPPESVWSVLDGIGGEHGWYSVPVAWWLRGLADRLLGGVGLRRGRRDPNRLAVGDAVDFWRVEERIPGVLLRLRAEMRMPGWGWLEFRIGTTTGGRTRLQQRAIFHPRSLAGHFYWWAVAPFQAVVFRAMARNIAAAARADAARTESAPPSRRL